MWGSGAEQSPGTRAVCVHTGVQESKGVPREAGGTPPCSGTGTPMVAFNSARGLCTGAVGECSHPLALQLLLGTVTSRREAVVAQGVLGARAGPGRRQLPCRKP